MLKSQPKIYFKNLNAIRFLAAFVVICHHIEQNKSHFNLPNFWHNSVVVMVGRLGVILFFVISGFLITYLLLIEKETTNTIAVKDFYFRRIFRIWPLYFLIVFLSFFILPNINSMNFGEFDSNIICENIKINLPLYLLLLPNLAISQFNSLHFASHLWSIGAEEQFYLVWPVLNKKFQNKWLLMISVVFIYLFVKYIFWYWPDSKFISGVNGFLYSIPIDCMAIGGSFSLIIYEKTKIVDNIKAFLFAKPVQWITLIGAILLIINGFHPYYLHEEIYSILFGILIINFATNENRIFSMDYKLLNYLGKISYGLYMYHLILVVFSIKILMYFGIFSNFLLYPLVLILTNIKIRYTYEYFELPLKINYRIYSKVQSGDNVKQ